MGTSSSVDLPELPELPSATELFDALDNNISQCACGDMEAGWVQLPDRMLDDPEESKGYTIEIERVNNMYFEIWTERDGERPRLLSAMLSPAVGASQLWLRIRGYSEVEGESVKFVLENYRIRGDDNPEGRGQELAWCIVSIDIK